MLRILFAFTILGLFFSCSSDDIYYLRTDDAEGVTAGADVFRQGVKVGTVSEVSFEDDDVLIEIRIGEPLYEDQDFDLQTGPEGKPAVELDRPDKGANELKPGSTLEQKGWGDLFSDDTGASLSNSLEEAGRELEVSIEEVFGKDGEKLKRKMENIFGRDGEKIKDAVENNIGRDGEKLEKSLEQLFGKDGEKIEALADQFGNEFKELGEEIERLERKYGKDTEEFEEAVKKALREWADSTN